MEDSFSCEIELLDVESLAVRLQIATLYGLKVDEYFDERVGPTAILVAEGWCQNEIVNRSIGVSVSIVGFDERKALRWAATLPFAINNREPQRQESILMVAAGTLALTRSVAINAFASELPGEVFEPRWKRWLFGKS